MYFFENLDKTFNTKTSYYSIDNKLISKILIGEGSKNINIKLINMYYKISILIFTVVSKNIINNILIFFINLWQLYY